MYHQVFQLLLISIIIFFTGCDKKKVDLPLDPGNGVRIDSETHWLTACDDQSSCGENLVCICGLCTTTCESADICGGQEITRCRSTSEDLRCEGADAPTQSAAVCWPTEDHPAVMFEICNDRIDNNNNQLIDCEDPECTGNDFCIDHPNHTPIK